VDGEEAGWVDVVVVVVVVVVVEVEEVRGVV
jgi:hypothetical protein